MIEHEIGQIVGIRDEKYIVEVANCQRCDIRDIVIDCSYLACRKSERSDKTSVIYKKLEAKDEK